MTRLMRKPIASTQMPQNVMKTRSASPPAAPWLGAQRSACEGMVDTPPDSHHRFSCHIPASSAPGSPRRAPWRRPCNGSSVECDKQGRNYETLSKNIYMYITVFIE